MSMQDLQDKQDEYNKSKEKPMDKGKGKSKDKGKGKKPMREPVDDSDSNSFHSADDGRGHEFGTSYNPTTGAGATDSAATDSGATGFASSSNAAN